MSKKKRRLVEDEIQVEDMTLDEVHAALRDLGAVDSGSAVVENDWWYDYDAARPIVRFKRPETKDERRVRKNPKPPQRLVFTSSDPLANLGATAPPEPGFIVSDTMPRDVPYGTIWINTGPEVTEPIKVDETPPSTRVSRYVWWPAAVIALLAVLYVVFLLVAAWRHS